MFPTLEGFVHMDYIYKCLYVLFEASKFWWNAL